MSQEQWKRSVGVGIALVINFILMVLTVAVGSSYPPLFRGGPWGDMLPHAHRITARDFLAAATLVLVLAVLILPVAEVVYRLRRLISTPHRAPAYIVLWWIAVLLVEGANILMLRDIQPGPFLPPAKSYVAPGTGSAYWFPATTCSAKTSRTAESLSLPITVRDCSACRLDGNSER